MKKQVLFLMYFLAMVACTSPSSAPVTGGADTTIKVTSRQQGSKYDMVEFVFIADRTRSFVEKYAYPDPVLFKPVCDTISTYTTLDFRYGIIHNYSDITFDRYNMPYVPKTSAPETDNPWMTSEAPAPVKQGTNWQEFAISVKSKLTASASKNSDVASAIGHAVIIFEECTGKKARKILLLCTDGLDSYRPLPTVPADIEVIVVGVLPDNQIARALHTTNVRRFESLPSALDFLTSLTF